MTTTPTLADIQTMDVPSFVQLVRNNLGFPDPRIDPIEAQLRQELWVHLTSREVIGRTERMLVDLLRAIDDQLATRKAAFDVFHQQCAEGGTTGKQNYFKGKAEYEDWRRGILENKRIVALRHAEVKRMLEMHRRNGGHVVSALPNPVKAQRNFDALFRLAYAVVQHRDAAADEQILPLPHDLELWEAADKITVMFGGGTESPLTDWVEQMTSKPDFTPPTF